MNEHLVEQINTTVNTADKVLKELKRINVNKIDVEVPFATKLMELLFATQTTLIRIRGKIDEANIPLLTTADARVKFALIAVQELINRKFAEEMKVVNEV